MSKMGYLIDARELKIKLLNKSDFSSWIKRIIKSNELIENKDYIIEKDEIKELRNKSTKANYFLTIEATKKIISNYSRNKIAKKIKEKLERENIAHNILEQINKEAEVNTRILEIDDEEYPEQLKKIKNPPTKLYVKGNIQNLKGYGIAVVGTRYCSNYGRRITKIFVNNLVGYNLNIISGLAIGTDRCAHKACIEAKGKTIAVLPSGLNNIFPKENQELVNQIIEKGGTVITEYPPEFEKTSESCRERNRIVSGLAIGTLVIEAGKYSGTSITVRHTNEQNKKAFCIPSSLLNSKGIGTNKMIKENSAQMVTDVEDIVKEFPELKLEKKLNFNFMKAGNQNITKKSVKKLKVNLEIEEENLEIYNFLNKEPKTIDEIAQELNKPIDEITYKLTLLELQGAIEKLPGKKFKTK